MTRKNKTEYKRTRKKQNRILNDKKKTKQNIK